MQDLSEPRLLTVAAGNEMIGKQYSAESAENDACHKDTWISVPSMDSGRVASCRSAASGGEAGRHSKWSAATSIHTRPAKVHSTGRRRASLFSTAITQKTTQLATNRKAPAAEFADTGESDMVRLQGVSVRALPSSLDVQLLRAVSTVEALSGFGRHWRSIAARKEDYDLSTSVGNLDDFLSHDWR
eukprot:TRINITY_DN122927_c0_g1_i1.p1 TRINITY_DN122927_c0_g1~~TRINITY_DN122927_c0_g1_i1.p1  ORF type:complete len:186 (-),score=34.02 TRINITY_DN122927_c0_g1_i1:68-625(-)